MPPTLVQPPFLQDVPILISSSSSSRWIKSKRDNDMMPTLWRAYKKASTVIITCPVPVSCSLKTMMWIMPVKANPQRPSINFHCQHDLHVYSDKKWMVAVTTGTWNREDKCLLAPFVSAAFSESFSFSRACLRELVTLCCNLAIGSSAL